MPSTYDFAIFGGNALAALLAGLLAHDHKKQVLLIAETVSPQRLPRGIDLGLLLATRPQTWKMLQRGIAETQSLVASLGAPEALEPTDVRVVADLEQTKAALSHVAATAAGYGQPTRDGSFRRLPRLAGPVSLADSRVVRIERDPVALEVTGGEPARLVISGEPAEVGQIVLADDDAVLELLPSDERPQRLAGQSMTVTLTAPCRRLPSPLMIYPDRGITLQQRADLSILAYVRGDHDIDARLAATLPGPFPIQRLATTHSHRAITTDGAPFVGRVKPSRLVMIAGLGDAAAFFAPMLARHLAGVATDDETAWLTSLRPSRPRDAIADFAGAA